MAVETRSKNSESSECNRESLEFLHGLEVISLNKKIKVLEGQNSARGALMFVYVASLLASYVWKYTDAIDQISILRTNVSKSTISTGLYSQVSHLNLLDLSILTALYHYGVYMLIRHRVFVSYTALVLSGIALTPFWSESLLKYNIRL